MFLDPAAGRRDRWVSGQLGKVLYGLGGQISCHRSCTQWAGHSAVSGPGCTVHIVPPHRRHSLTWCFKTSSQRAQGQPQGADRGSASSMRLVDLMPTSHKIHKARNLLPRCSQPTAHCWLAPPLQVHRSTLLPLAVPWPATSRQRPDLTLVMVPLDCSCHCWLVPPLQV
jgi:hypothetical protein